MARRRKKSKAAAAAKARNKENSPMVMEKSLPALPPNAIPPNAFSDDRVDPDSDTPTEQSSTRPRGSRKHSETESRDNSRPARPARSPDRPSSTSKTDGLGLPPSAYRNNRNSSIYQSVDSTGDDGFFIPVALDRSPGPSSSEQPSDSGLDGRRREKDYFSGAKGITHEKRSDSLNSTPHIAFQDKSPQLGRDSEAAPTLTGRFRAPSDQGQRKGSVSGDDGSAEATKGRHPQASRSNSSQSSVPQVAGHGKADSGIVRKDGHANLSEARRSNEQATSSEKENVNGTGKFDAKAIPRKEVPSSISRSGKSSQCAFGPLAQT